MERSRPCSSCTKRTLVTDDESGNLICSSCGIVQDFDNFQANIGGINGPTGTYVRIGSAGTGNEFSYKEMKIYKAQTLLDDIMFRLGLSPSRSNEVKLMIETITDGEYGQGNWFPVFIGACAYVVMRKANKSLPITEVANVIGCDIHEVGRMVTRVTNFLDLKLPEFDIVNSFERAIRTCPSFTCIENDKVERMLKQGIFLLQCLVKWFITTGRTPLPVVVAVLFFVAQLNLVDVKIADVARELHMSVSTCKLRYKELLERLVEVAQALPWGKDVTVKNVLKNAPFVIQYMEMRSMSKNGKKGKNFGNVRFDMGDLVGDVLSKGVDTWTDGYESYGRKNNSQYFEANLPSSWSVDDLERLKVSPECLSTIYLKFLDEFNGVKSTIENGEDSRRKRGRGFDAPVCKNTTEWWKGKSELSRKAFLKKILEKDVGLDPMPPSFVSGCLAYDRRREKIKAAKMRIGLIMHPQVAGSVDKDNRFLPSCVEKENLSVSSCVKFGKKRKKLKVDIDWEDFVIETLLLHQVKEDEIEKGHYNALLDLHVFNYGSS
ncbi:hypothetical protein LguiB_002072 [Lonicera macranthoides]